MTENSFVLEVMQTYGVLRMTYPTREAADAALAGIEPKIGERFSNDPERRKHRLEGPDGSMVVDIEHTYAVRVLDCAVYDAGMAFLKDLELETARKLAKVTAEALKAAGVAVMPGREP